MRKPTKLSSQEIRRHVIDKNTDPSTSRKVCCWDVCEEEGTYPAPKYRDERRAFFWFCLEHIRTFNSGWDFFEHMPPHDIEAFQRGIPLGHRPTWKIGVDTALYEAQIRQKAAAFLFNQKPDKAPPTLPTQERDALAVMNLAYPVTLKDIKDRYKSLVKQYHPDVNQHHTQAEEIFKKISAAYRLLIQSSWFKQE